MAGMDMSGMMMPGMLTPAQMEALRLAQGKEFARKVKSRAAEVYGRNPDEVLILPGLWPILGSTEAEARERRDLLTSLSEDPDALASLAAQLGLPPDSLALDGPLPWHLVDSPDWKPSSFGFANSVLSTARNEGLTARQLLDRHMAGGGHRIVAGTPEQVANEIEEFFTEGAADGFNLNHDFYPDGLDLIVDHLVPELQRRGLFRRQYESTTLRGNLGLPVPATAVPGLGRPAVAS